MRLSNLRQLQGEWFNRLNIVGLDTCFNIFQIVHVTSLAAGNKRFNIYVNSKLIIRKRFRNMSNLLNLRTYIVLHNITTSSFKKEKMITLDTV